MVELTNSLAQTLAAGQSVTFDTVILRDSCGTCYRKGTGSVKMTTNSVYEVHFSGNVSSDTASTPVQLSLTAGGVTIPGSTMISTPTTANNVNNVAKTVLVANCCGDYDRITVTNTGTNPITIAANPVFYVKFA